MASLRQALAEAEREGAGAAVQALRDQVAEQAAEVASLRQALAEAEREGAGAAVQALRDQVVASRRRRWRRCGRRLLRLSARALVPLCGCCATRLTEAGSGGGVAAAGAC
ncbi:hypothetical protein GH5_03522 [Leishmania sp. Ghana 2012 LV757]|uniref:hypothetical protein n=1 Tax=Leishmania sp. Ghana 2012 LV757 TaxID=2803181 RepID=UPI001B77314E|nr:hypothetical protein GH5_03522 [Leishmania sp. Ghana 2012 LV757]